MIQLGYKLMSEEHGPRALLLQIGPDQKGFVDFFERELAPARASAFGESVRGR